MKFIKYSVFLLTFSSLSYIIADEKKGVKVKVKNYLSKVKNKSINPDKTNADKVITKTENTNVEVLQMKSEPGSNNIIINVITNDKDKKSTSEESYINKNNKDLEENKLLKVNKKKPIKKKKAMPKKVEEAIIAPQQVNTENKIQEAEEIEYIVKEEYIDENGNLIKTNTRPASQQEIEKERGGIKPSASIENPKNKTPTFDKE